MTKVTKNEIKWEDRSIGVEGVADAPKSGIADLEIRTSQDAIDAVDGILSDRVVTTEELAQLNSGRYSGKKETEYAGGVAYQIREEVEGLLRTASLKIVAHDQNDKSSVGRLVTAKSTRKASYVRISEADVANIRNRAHEAGLRQAFPLGRFQRAMSRFPDAYGESSLSSALVRKSLLPTTWKKTEAIWKDVLSGKTVPNFEDPDAWIESELTKILGEPYPDGWTQGGLKDELRRAFPAGFFAQAGVLDKAQEQAVGGAVDPGKVEVGVAFHEGLFYRAMERFPGAFPESKLGPGFVRVEDYPKKEAWQLAEALHAKVLSGALKPDFANPSKWIEDQMAEQLGPPFPRGWTLEKLKRATRSSFPAGYFKMDGELGKTLKPRKIQKVSAKGQDVAYAFPHGKFFAAMKCFPGAYPESKLGPDWVGTQPSGKAFNAVGRLWQDVQDGKVQPDFSDPDGWIRGQMTEMFGEPFPGGWSLPALRDALQNTFPKDFLSKAGVVDATTAPGGYSFPQSGLYIEQFIGATAVSVFPTISHLANEVLLDFIR